MLTDSLADLVCCLPYTPEVLWSEMTRLGPCPSSLELYHLFCHFDLTEWHCWEVVGSVEEVAEWHPGRSVGHWRCTLKGLCAPCAPTITYCLVIDPKATEPATWDWNLPSYEPSFSLQTDQLRCVAAVTGTD